MWKKIPLKSMLYLSVGVNIAVSAIIILVRSFLPPIVPLLYGLPYGESQLVPTLWLLIIPSGSLVITFLNIIFAVNLKDLFYKRTLITASAFVSVLGAVTVIKIIFLVGLF